MISSVRKREQILLNNYTPFKSDVMVKHIYQDIITNKYVYENAKIVLNNWENLDTNQNIALAKVLNVMEQAYINGNTGNINSLTYIVCENVIPKVRDAEQSGAPKYRFAGEYTLPSYYSGYDDMRVIFPDEVSVEKTGI